MGFTNLSTVQSEMLPAAARQMYSAAVFYLVIFSLLIPVYAFCGYCMDNRNDYAKSVGLRMAYYVTLYVVLLLTWVASWMFGQGLCTCWWIVRCPSVPPTLPRKSTDENMLLKLLSAEHRVSQLVQGRKVSCLPVPLNQCTAHHPRQRRQQSCVD